MVYGEESQKPTASRTRVAILAVWWLIGVPLLIGLWFWLGWWVLVLAGLGVWAWAALALNAALLARENALVRPEDLSKVGPAFLTFNAAVSVVFLAGCAIEVLTSP